MRAGARVIVDAGWGHFRGRVGRVVAMWADACTVLLEGESRPLRFDLRHVFEESCRHVGGAE